MAEVKLTAAQKAAKAVEEQTKKLAQAKARQKLIEAKEKKRENAEKRKREDKQKYLLGSFVLVQMQKAKQNPALLAYAEQKFGDWLTRPADREAFGLKPLDRPA